MFDVDTLRPDHMGCYGYSRNTTPVIDDIAKDGVIFNKYYASDTPCLPSRTALVTGMFGIHSGAVGHGGTAADKRLQGCERKFTCESDENNLFNVFRKAGMHTASISTFPEKHSAWWFNSGFNEMYNIDRGGDESGEEVLPTVLNWLNQNAEKGLSQLLCERLNAMQIERKNLAFVVSTMYKFDDGQISIDEFEQPIGMHLKAENRWVKKAMLIPWGAIERRYAKLFTNQKGNVTKPLRLALGACLIRKRQLR